MTKHQASPDDQAFLRRFEACETCPDDFDHRAHVRLAYICLCESPVEDAHRRMRQSLIAYLNHIGAGASKYHETITRSWILAINHFMTSSSPCASAAGLMEKNPVLLESRIMLSHYSKGVLLSSQARESFVEPDLQPISVD